MEKNTQFKKGNKMKIHLLPALCCFFLFVGCHTTKVVMPSVQGMIYDADNESVSDVEIFIDGKKNAVSDIYGHFTLTGLTASKDYSLRAAKKGYEDVELLFTYSVPSQVIYLHMYSAAELLASAEAMTEEKKFREAEDFLNRAELAGGNFLGINYLRACIKYLVADYDSALSIANSIIEAGYIDSYISLLFADIYENGFSDSDKTKLYLQKSLELSYDPLVEKRLLGK